MRRGGGKARATAPRATAVALVTLLALAGCAEIVREDSRWIVRRPTADLLAGGREEFVQACASCHGADGRGGGPVAPALRSAPADLTMLAERAGGRFPREHVLQVLGSELAVDAHGSREMPVWSERFAPSSGATTAAAIYTRRRAEMLVSYLGSIQRAALTP